MTPAKDQTLPTDTCSRLPKTCSVGAFWHVPRETSGLRSPGVPWGTPGTAFAGTMRHFFSEHDDGTRGKVGFSTVVSGEDRDMLFKPPTLLNPHLGHV